MERYSDLHETKIIERADGTKHLNGYAAVFYDGTPNTEYYRPDLKVYERIRPTAFNGSIIRRDRVELRYNHDKNSVLDDTDKTLALSVDKKGLKYDSPVDERDPDYQKVLVKIQKGIVRGSSFIYRVTDAAMDRDGDKDVLWIEDGKLREVSPVNSPAYRGTDVIVRSEDDEVIFRTYDQWKAQQETLKRREFLKTLKD